MFDTVMQLQHADMNELKDSAPAIAQTSLLLELFDAHAHHEDSCILDAVKALAPEIIEIFEAEHTTDLHLSTELRTKIKQYLNATDRIVAGAELFHALNNFVAFNLGHMSKEETLLNNLLWKHFSDEEIEMMERNIQQAIAPEKMDVYLEWMIKGVNDRELAQWLSEIKQSAPPFVLEHMLGACENFLPQPRWKNLELRLMVGTALNQINDPTIAVN